MGTEFKYAPMFQLGKDETEYYLLTKEGVSVSEFEGHKMLKVSPEALTMLSQQCFHDVEFMLDHGRPGVYAIVDPQRIQVIMGQFLRNAFKFTKKGYVKLGWNYDLDNGTVLLYVEDTGCGISEDKRKYIFNLFWKDDMFTTGVGIGLTIAKTFTEKMDGKVVVHTRKGIGSCFGSQFKAYIKL